MKNSKSILFIILTLAAVLASCSKESIHGDGFNYIGQSNKVSTNRAGSTEKRNVLVLYSAGFNSISSYLTEDIQDLQKGWLPGSSRNDNILLVYSHAPARRGDYGTPNAPTLTRLYKAPNGSVVLDTLVRYPAETHSATAQQLHDVLDYVKTSFPARSYGMIFSSHATGYLPAGFYTNPHNYTYQPKGGISYRRGFREYVPQPVPYVEPEHDPSMPAVKSIGQDQVGTYGSYQSYEIELDDFVNALPMEMEYILFDACLMGGVEVAYELKDKCRLVGFSQTEVLAEGYNYKTLTTHLLGSDHPNPQAVCEDFFHQYDIQVDPLYRSATISMIDCTKMGPLAEVCSTLFEKYRSEIDGLDPYKVQRYYRGSDHWFYDLKDIIIRAGATSEEIAQLQDALDECVTYKAATPMFMTSFSIVTYSGLSMYLPCNGKAELDKYYRTLEWNKATSLLK